MFFLLCHLTCSVFSEAKRAHIAEIIHNELSHNMFLLKLTKGSADARVTLVLVLLLEL